MSQPTSEQSNARDAASGATIEADMLKTLAEPGAGHKLAVITLALVFGWGAIAYIHQLHIGLAATVARPPAKR